MNYVSRRDQVRARLRLLGTDAFLITNPVNVRYLTGFTGSNGQLVISDGDVFATDGRYGTVAAALGLETFFYEQNVALASALEPLLKKFSSVAFEGAHTSLPQYRALDELGLVLVETTGVIENLRKIKDEDELAAIISAQQLTERVVEETVPGFVGTESDLALELEWKIRRLGATTSFDIIVASAEHSAIPHARPREVLLGSDVLVDIGSRVDGYCSDMTRTWAGTSKIRELQGIVNDALSAAVDAVAPGARCSEIDRVARDVISSAGYGEFFVHSTGHSLGLDIHESPRFAAASADTLEVGMVMTIEPGIYLPGVGGVRIEDMVVVTEQGSKNLTKLPRLPG